MAIIITWANNEYLTENASILECPEFISGVLKVIRGEEIRMSHAEQIALKRFKKPVDPAVDADEDKQEVVPLQDPEDWASGILSNLNKRKTRSGSAYYSPHFVMPTQVECERLFSITKYILEQQRSGMSDYSFEMAAFLKIHRDLWDEVTVTKAVEEVAE